MEMSKARVIKSPHFQDILKDTPLKIRLNVINEMSIQSFLIDSGYVPDGFWTDDKEEKFGGFREFAKELTENQISEFNRWEKDGRPT